MKQGMNPYLPSYEYVPDGEPHIFENRLWIFGSHDGFAYDDFCLNDYVTWSAPLDDLSDWRYEGIIYKKTQDPENPKGKSHMNAPDVCQGSDGRYYLYYQLHDKYFTSVAVSDKPQGPYEFYGYVKHPDGKTYGSKKGDSYNFDPGVLVDDNGRVYFYTGFAPNEEFPKIFSFFMKLSGASFKGGCCVELEQDMLTVKSETYSLIPGEVEAKGTNFEGHGFFEASSPRKIGETYYLVYSSQLSHELCYATSKSPTGPYRYGGTIISIGDIGLEGIHSKEEARNYTGNTHGGLVQVKDQWYIFYHRQTNQKRCNRQGCAEKVTILWDGRIPQVEMTSCGLNQGPLKATGDYEARIACNLWCKEPSFSYGTNKKRNYINHPYFTQSGQDREENGDQYIANMRDGATAGFKYFAFHEDRPNKIAIEIRGTAKGRIKIYGTEGKEKLLAEIRVDLKDDQIWKKVEADFAPPEETSALYFVYEGDGTLDFNQFSLW